MVALNNDPYATGIWVRCTMCDDMWCNRHKQHVADCDCPSIDVWLQARFEDTDISFGLDPLGCLMDQIVDEE